MADIELNGETAKNPACIRAIGWMMFLRGLGWAAIWVAVAWGTVHLMRGCAEAVAIRDAATAGGGA